MSTLIHPPSSRAAQPIGGPHPRPRAGFRPIQLPRALAWTLALAALAAATGCQRQASDRLDVHPVAGKVTFKGKPVPNALVVLHPKAAAEESKITARGQTDPNGTFRLTTYEANDGAPEGEYAVTVVLHQLRRDGDSFVPGPNVLPKKLALPSSTDITVRVSAGENHLDPIEVRR